MKLYKVTLSGFNGSGQKESWVVAPDAEDAYQAVLEYLEEEDIGFRTDRQMESVELVVVTRREE